MRTKRFLVFLVTMAACVHAYAADPPVEPILSLETAFHTARIQHVSTDSQARFFLTCSDDKSARLWDTEGRPLKVFRVPMASGNEGMLFACALSPDGNTVALGGWTGNEWDGSCSIYIFERESGTLVRRLAGLENVIDDLHFSPDGSLLGCALGEKGIRLYNCRTWTQVYADRDYGSGSYSIVFSQDSRYAASSSLDGYLRLYQLEPPSRIAIITAQGGKQPYGFSFSPDGRFLACGFLDTTKVDVYSVSDGGLSYSYSPDTTGINNGSLNSVVFSADGRSLAAGGTYWDGWGYPVRLWSEARRGAYRDLDIGAFSAIKDLTALPDGSLLVGAADPALSRVSIEGKILFKLKGGIADYRDNPIGLSPEAKTFSFAYELWGKRPASFSLSSRQISEPASGLTGPDTTSLQVTDWNNTYDPKLNGKALVLEQYERSHSLAVAPGASRFLLGTDWKLRCYNASGKPLWEKPTPDTAWAVNVSGDGRIGVVACGDGTIRFLRMSDGEEVLAFFPHADGKRWVLFTPSGYYDASPGAEDFLGWHLNNGKDRAPDFFPIHRFRGRFYRPDVISLALDTLDEKTALARADKEAGRKNQNFSLKDAVPPILTIVHPDSGVEVSATRLTVKYLLRMPSGEPVTAIRVLVDGRPSSTPRGLTVAPQEGTVYSVEVELPERDAIVSVIAENRYAASEPVSIRTVWKGKSEDFLIKPKLYVLAVGVSNYQQASLRLGYASKDARDFAAALAVQKGKLYRDVELKVLTDSNATKDDILDGLEWIQRAATSKDVAMVFMAGHGVNDPNGVYYYLPVNADPERLKRTCLPFTDVQTTVRAIAGKALFFIDTCHSGNIMGEGARRGSSDINAVVNELSSAENGVVVFAASTGNQYSVEKPEWENGAFTKALVEGLLGNADYSGSGRITVNMLDLYLSERVKQLTGGVQTPTTTKPPSVPDFPVVLN